MTDGTTSLSARARSMDPAFLLRGSRSGPLLVAAIAATLAGCASQDQFAQRPGSRFDARLGVSSSPRVVEEGRPVPRGGGVYRIGRPYTVAGRRYTPFEKREGHTEVGVASWYGRQFHGRLTANGEVYDMNSLSAAHRTMPMPSYARVTNLRNGRSIIVRVNDRGPFHANRVIDLSHRASHLLDFRGMGLARVRVEYVGRAPLEGSDDRALLATLRMDGSPAPKPEGGAPAVMVASASPTFVPQTPAQPAVVEARAPITQLSGGMPLPPERPFELGLSGSSQVALARPPEAPARAAPAPASAPVMASAPLPPTPPASPVPSAPALAASSSVPLTAGAAFAPAPAAPSALAAMPGLPAPRTSFAAGGLY